MDYAAELSGPADSGSSLPVVTVGDVEAIVSSWTGVPVERMTDNETERLATLVSPGGGAFGARMRKPWLAWGLAGEVGIAFGLGNCLQSSSCQSPHLPSRYKEVF